LIGVTAGRGRQTPATGRSTERPPELCKAFIVMALPKSLNLAKDLSLFRRTRMLEKQIEEFLDKLSQSGLLFRAALEIYLTEGASDAFEDKLASVNTLESEADKLRRAIEVELYAHTLIPEARGDVLGLLENLDSVLNVYEGTMWNFSIETPDIPEEFRDDFRSLGDQVVNAVESLVLASRNFFRDPAAVSDHMHKVMFYEKQADKVSTKLKRAIFASSLALAHKAHLRNFVEQMDNLADRSEDVVDRLAIYTIKRTV
jgi:predicted phosphate transport protein (TIGR00153 family)